MVLTTAKMTHSKKIPSKDGELFISNVYSESESVSESVDESDEDDESLSFWCSMGLRHRTDRLFRTIGNVPYMLGVLFMYVFSGVIGMGNGFDDGRGEGAVDDRVG